MKRYTAVFLLCCLLLSGLCGCKKKPSNHSTEPTEPQAFTSTMVAVSVPATTETAKAKDGTVLFEYTFQHMSLVLHRPAIADKIISDFTKRVDSTRKNAETTKTKAENAYNASKDWVPYLCHVAYSPTRIDHKVLSLFGTNVDYTGGHHPNTTCMAVNYDMSTGNVLTLSSILTPEATIDILQALALEALAEMAEGDYLYEHYTGIVNQRFQTDLTTDENWYFSQRGLCFYFAPYEIAPYTSGIITAEIPYEKLAGLLRPEFLQVDRENTEGSVTLSPFDNVNLEEFANIAELVTDNKADMHIVCTEGNVQDVRISVRDKYSQYTVFAIYNMSARDGIVIQATNEMLAKMQIHYKNGNDTITAPLID